MRASVRVATSASAYDVVVGPGVLANLAEDLTRLLSAGTVVIVTDDAVGDLFGVKLEASFAAKGFHTRMLAVAPGETSKNWALAGELCEQFAACGLDRQDAVIALGGGVVGDLAGFAAAVYMRGIDFVQVPTTLLAMVDASVGGKTAVDLRAGKNLVGAFKQPRAVYADTDVLGSLPEAEWRSGLAEVAKSALLSGEEFTVWLEQHAAELVERDPRVVEEAVVRCVEFKAATVSQDEYESDVRECLNYGHTLGHALEVVFGYGCVTHGEAVAEGMRFVARLGMETAGVDRDFVVRQDRLLTRLGLPRVDQVASAGALLQAMKSDKKARSGQVRFVVLRQPGQWACEPVADSTIEEHLIAWVASREKG